MPRYGVLRRTLGDDVRMRILTYHHHIQNLPADPATDIRLTWETAAAGPEDRVVVSPPAGRANAARPFLRSAHRTGAGPERTWVGVP